MSGCEILEVYNFDPLYGKDIKGKIKIWKIKVERYLDYSVIVTQHGYTNLVETRRQINSGKNIGKINMTTTYTQAISEAKSKWVKKKDIEKFSKTKEELSELIENKETGKVDDVKENPLPMLAQDYKKQKNKVIYPAMVQAKLDGFRFLYNTTSGKMSTRQGKEYSIVKESGKLYDELKNLPKGLILDGELYTSKVNFEVLGVLRKTKKLTNEELVNLQKIEYHIYDIVNTDDTFEERNKKIRELNLKTCEKLIYVNTYVVNNEDEIKKYHKKFLEEGYEGTMIRNKKSLYKIKQRSYDLLKYKDFDDAEFKIVDYTYEKDTSGDDENLIVWVIAVSENKTCKVRPQGSSKERKELYKKCVEDFNQFKGRNIWIKFFEYTNDGSLRFPSTLRNTYTEYIRDVVE